jgi:nucleotide-binding universal stress UspA family protein
MKQILVAVDEHPHAKQIVEKAIELAGALSAEIILVYVVKDASVPSRYVDVHGDAIPEHYYLDQWHRTVDELVKSIENAGIKHDGVCGVGDPQDVILKTAQKRNVSYIVVGARKFKGLGRLRVIGDVATNVIESATVPVVAVP